MRWLEFALGDLLVLIGAVALTLRLPLVGRSERLLGAIVLALGQVVIACLIAGWGFASLRPNTLLAINAVISGGIVVVSRSRLNQVSIWPSRDGWALERPAAPTPPRALNLLAVALVAVVTLELVWRAVVAYALPPYGFDALAYHLTTVGGWVHSGSLARNPLTEFAYAFPTNGELLTAWMPLFLRTTALIGLTQLPFAVIAGVTTAALGRTLGLSRAGAVAAGCLLFLTPIVLQQSTTTYVDDIFAALVLLSVFFLVRFVADIESRRFTLIALAGLAGGLALGTKPTGIFYVAVIGTFLVGWLMWAWRRARMRMGSALGALALFVGGVMLVGSFWFLRNTADYHNPVYPVKARALGHQLRGWRAPSDVIEQSSVAPGKPWPVQVARSWAHDLVIGAHGYEPYGADQRKGGLGPQWVYLELPLLVVSTWLALRRRDVVALTVVGILGLILLVQPYRWWSRFTIALVAPGAIAVAWTIERWARPRWQALLALATAGIVGYSLIFSTFSFDLGTHRSVNAADVLRLATSQRSRRTIGKVVYPPYRWLDGIDRRAPIGVAASRNPKVKLRPGRLQGVRILAPLYGSHFQHAVYQLEERSQARFLRQVAARRIAFVVAYPDGRVDGWASGDRTRFAPYATDDAVRVYRVVR